MADDKTTLVLDLDNAEFTSKIRESLGLMEGFGNIEGLAKLGMQLVELGEIFAPIVIAILAVKAALDLTKEAEHIEAIEKSFQMLAKSAGLAGDALKEKLIAAAGGLASETEILQAANQAIIGMGENANRLPEIMELARKRTAGFGGDLVTNFENLSRALESGSPKMLRQFGIMIDVNKAHEDFAKSVGFGATVLDQESQRVAVMNAALAQMQEKYKDIDTSTLKTTNSTKGLWTSVKELWEAFEVGINKAFKLSEKFSAVINTISGFVQKLTANVKYHYGISDEGSKDHQKNLQKEAENTKNAAEEEKKRAVARITSQEKYKADVNKFNAELVKIAQDRAKQDEAIETNLENFKKLRLQEIQNAEHQAAEEEKKIRQQAAQLGLAHSAQVAEAIKNIEKKKTDEIQKIRNKSYQDEYNALKNLENQNRNTAQGIMIGWRTALAQSKMEVNDMGKQGEKAFGSLKSHAISAFQEMGKGAKSGGDIVKGFMLGTLGDVATQWGEFHLINGAATYNFVEVAEGGALIALGAALQSIGSSSGSSASSGGGGGGGGGGGAGGASAYGPSTAASPQTQAATQHKTLTIAFHGDYLDTDATRTKFMDMIRQSGDYTDFNLLKVGQSS